MADSLETRLTLAIDTAGAAQNIGDVKRAIKELENVALSAGDSNSQAFIKATQEAGRLRDSIEDVKDATKTFKGDPLEGLSAGLGSLKGRLADLDFAGFNEEVGRLGILSKEVTLDKLSSSVAETGSSFLQLGKILLTNPIFLIGGTIAAIVVYWEDLDRAIKSLNPELERQKALTSALNAEIKAQSTNVAKQRVEIEGLFDAVLDETKAETERKAALDNLQLIYPDLFKNQNIDLNNTDALRTAKLNLVAAIEAEAKANASKALLEKEFAKQFDLQVQIQEKQVFLSEAQRKEAEATANTSRNTAAEIEQYSLKVIQAGNSTANALAEVTAAQNELNIVNKNIADVKKIIGETVVEPKKTTPPSGPQGGGGKNATKKLKSDLDEQNQLIIDANNERLDEEERLQEEIQSYRLTAQQKEERRINDEFFYKKNQFKEGSNEYISIENEQNKQIQEIRSKFAVESLKDIQKSFGDVSTSITLEANKNILDLTNSTNEELVTLNEQYRNGEIKSLEEYEEKKAVIIEKEEDKRRQIELESAQKRLTNIENEAKNALALLPEGSQEYKDAKAKYDSDRISGEQVVADKLREINQDYTNDVIAEEQRLADEQEKNRQIRIKTSEDTFDSISGLISQTSVGFESLGTDILEAASNIGGQITATIATFTDKNATATDKLIAGFQAASAVIGEIGNILSAEADRRIEEINLVKDTELEASENSKNKQIADLETQLEEGTITKEQFDKRKIKIEQELATSQFEINEKAREAEYNAKKKVFQQEKKIRIAQAISAGAQAAIAAFASGASVPIVGPITTGPAFAAIAAAFTTAQVALISAQKFESFQAGTPPTFSTPSTGGGGGGEGGGNQNTFSPPQFFGLGQGIFESQAAGSQTQQVIVLESDITNVQNRVRVIEDRATIG